MPNPLTTLFEWLSDLFRSRPQPRTTLTTLRPRILMIVFNPVIESEGGRKLTEVLNWNDPDRLAADYIADLRDASHGLVEPTIVERVEVDEWPIKQDTFRYDDTFVSLWRSRGLFHAPDRLDYAALLQRFDILGKVASNVVDEVWCFAFPFAGFHESTMGGRDAFHCNSEPLPNTRQCPRKFIVMGFNYERDVGEMLESFGHRCEDILRRVYQGTGAEANTFARFCLYERTAPGRAACGTVHCAPNSQICTENPRPALGETDREWDNPRVVACNCDDWLNYPNLTGATRQVDHTEWGAGDVRLHHAWWLRHFPRAAGATGGISNNWWNYVADPNQVR